MPELVHGAFLRRLPAPVGRRWMWIARWPFLVRRPFWPLKWDGVEFRKYTSAGVDPAAPGGEDRYLALIGPDYVRICKGDAAPVWASITDRPTITGELGHIGEISFVLQQSEQDGQQDE